MTELVVFLKARLDETAAKAQKAKDGPRNQHVDADDDIEPLLFNDQGEFDLPDRVLADVEAKRRLLAMYDDATFRAKHPVDSLGLVAANAERAALEEAFTAFAAVYADHPDYREEWRP